MADNDFVLTFRVNAEDLIPEELLKLTREEQVERFSLLMSDIGDAVDINQQIVAPFNLALLAVGTPFAYATVPSGIQEWGGGAFLRSDEDLSNVTEARVAARVTTASNAAGILAIQAAPIGTGTFDYLDGVAGPKVSLVSGGTLLSEWVPVTGDLRGDVELRVVHVGGDSSGSPAITNVSVKFR
jgi:hypothetical protein